MGDRADDDDETLSQHSSVFAFGEADITDAIALFETQPSASESEGASTRTTPSTPPIQTGRVNLDETALVSASTSTSTAVQQRTDAPPMFSTASTLGKRKTDKALLVPASPTRPSKIPRSDFQLRTRGQPSPLAPKALSDIDPQTPVILSYPKLWADLFQHIPYGAKYEICRLYNSSHFREFSFEGAQKLQGLKTNAAAAPQVPFIIMGEDSDDSFSHLYVKESDARSPWKELDREEAALAKCPFAGLGFNRDGTPSGWYGGQVEFRGTLSLEDSSKSDDRYRLKLEPPILGPSNQFSRRFGSKNIFRIKLTKKSLNSGSTHLMNYLRRPFVICGSVFRAFFAKEANVFFIKTNEAVDVQGQIDPNRTVDGVMSFFDFINWHNSLEENCNQAMSKWASRFALGLSNSVPGILLKPDSIQFEDDIVNPHSKSNMTDGAGSLNRTITCQLHHQFEWDERPTALQVRVFGSKGLLVDDKSDIHEEPLIHLTPSQIKIKYAKEDADPAHLIIDVLRASHAKPHCRLSTETIINLWENGVPKESFVSLLQEGLDMIVQPLLDWNSPDSLFELWCNLQHLGGVLAARRAREQVGTARVKGLSERDLDENEVDDEDGFTQLNIVEQKSSAWWADPVSGSPSSLEETSMGLLDSGFTPNNCPVLREKLRMVIKRCIRNYIKSYRIEVPMSSSAFITPDKLGVLEHGEIFYKTSHRKLLLPDGTETDTLLGYVLITRHPCKLPTDIQKWKAVYRPELQDRVDVIVMSTKGSRRAADWLAGGDYDGDTAQLLWQPELVKHFKPAPSHFANPPPNIELNFLAENESVQDFKNRTLTQSPIQFVHQLQHYLLGAVRDTSVVGKYSIYHENAIYKLGYQHPQTIRLAYMFCMTLDGSKTGMSVKPDVLERDGKAHNHRAPAWKETEEEKERAQHLNQANLQRPTTLGHFIMDDLHKEAEIQGDIWLAKIEKHYEAFSNACQPDPDLRAPYDNILSKSNNPKFSYYQSDLEKIRKHVEEVYQEHRDRIAQLGRETSKASGASPRKLGLGSPQKDARTGFTDLPIERRQDILRSISKKFASKPSPEEMALPADYLPTIKASFAYVYDWEQRVKSKKSIQWSRFPWDVAYRELCSIKARATGHHKTVVNDFYERFNMKHRRHH